MSGRAENIKKFKVLTADCAFYRVSIPSNPRIGIYLADFIWDNRRDGLSSSHQL